MQSHILSTVEDIKAMVEHVNANNYDFIALDVETDSTQEKIAKLYGIGLAFCENEAFYIPIRNKNGELVFNDRTIFKLKQTLLEWCKTKKLIGHNIIYDILVIENNWNIDLTEYIFADTILMKHAVDEERPFGLKETAVKFLGSWADKAQETLYENIKANGGQITKANMEIYKADTEVLGEYCCWDVMLTMKLYNLFMPLIKADNGLELFFEETMPLYKLGTIPMKRHGFPIDVEHFKDLKDEINIDILKLRSDIYKSIKNDTIEYENNLLDKLHPHSRSGGFVKAAATYFGVILPEKDGKISIAKKGILAIRDDNKFFSWFLDNEELDKNIIRNIQHIAYKTSTEEDQIFNINSNDHLAWLFFTKYQIKCEEKTETGKPKIGKDILEEMVSDHPVVDLILEYKKLMKLKSTYIDGILEKVTNGRIYPSFLQFGTTSGRYSSTNPNCQNLPRIKDEESKISPLVLKYVNAIKRGFIAGEGKKIVNADVDSLEPTCFAAVSGDPKLQEVFLKKTDLYSSVAINVFGLKNFSADKKDPMYLKEHRPEYRQQAKTFCFTANTIVETEKDGFCTIEDVQVGDKIKTKYGFKLITKTFRRKAPIVTVITEKRIFKCTPDHKFFCPKTNDFKEISKFNLDDHLEYITTEPINSNIIKKFDQFKYSGRLKKVVEEKLTLFEVCRAAIEEKTNEKRTDAFNFGMGQVIKTIDVLNMPENLRLAYFIASLWSPYFDKNLIVEFKNQFRANCFVMLGETLGLTIKIDVARNECYTTSLDEKSRIQLKGLIKKHKFPDFKLLRRIVDRITKKTAALDIDEHKNLGAILGIIKDKESYPVYDITVDEVHEFYANGTRVHNCLAVVYGAEAGRISKLMNVSYQEADSIIHKYMDAYPQLKTYLSNCTDSVLNDGKVTTIYGRTRHLPEAKRLYTLYGDKLLDPVWCKKTGRNDLRWKLKGMLNLSKNHPIQGLASHIMNRAIISIAKKFKELGIDGQLVACVHDELTYIVKESQAELALSIVKDGIENTTKIAVPLTTTPLIAANWAEAK